MDGNGWLEPWSARSDVRLILIAEATWAGQHTEGPRGIADVLAFGRLHDHVSDSAPHLPQCTDHAELDPSTVRWKRLVGGAEVAKIVESVWEVPGVDAQFFVQLIDLRLTGDLRSVIPALEDMYYGDAVAEGSTLGADRVSAGRTHQIVVLSDWDTTAGDVSGDDVQRLIYRADLPARMEYCEISRPAELNRRPGRGAALGPFVSVLWGQQDYMENCVFMSALTACASGSFISSTRKSVLSAIRDLRDGALDTGSEKTVRGRFDARRRTLEDARRQVSEAENGLAICVDGLASMMPFVPALRLESYHRGLTGALDLDEGRTGLERMLDRLGRIVESEADILDSMIDRANGLRTRRWTLSVTLASLVAVPFGIVFGFLGMSAAEVDSTRSFTDPAYGPLYGFVAAVTVLIAATHFGLFLVHRRGQMAEAEEVVG